MTRASSHHVLVALTLLATSACGASQESRGTTSARSEGPPAGASNDNVPPSASASAPTDPDAGTVASVEGRDVEGQILVSGPGFAPPILEGSGVAGGSVEGHGGPMGCTGHYPDRPQHVLKVGRTVPMLRVMADGVDRDLTLALRTPDGQWHCNDDSGDPGYGLNPAVDLTNASGEIEVYVGVFSEESSGAQYTLGVTEDPNRYGSSTRPGGLAIPPQPPGGGGAGGMMPF